MKTIGHYFVVGIGVYLGWTFAYAIDRSLWKRVFGRKENNHAEN